MSSFLIPDNCYGCGLCEQVCDNNAINMIEKNGFKHPVVDSEKCIGCKKCELNCIAKNPALPELSCHNFYAAALKNKEELKRSSSGGMFYALACYIINIGGFVCGCIWNDNLEAEHIVTNDLEFAVP